MPASIEELKAQLNEAQNSFRNSIGHIDTASGTMHEAAAPLRQIDEAVETTSPLINKMAENLQTTAAGLLALRTTFENARPHATQLRRAGTTARDELHAARGAERDGIGTFNAAMEGAGSGVYMDVDEVSAIMPAVREAILMRLFGEAAASHLDAHGKKAIELAQRTGNLAADLEAFSDEVRATGESHTSRRSAITPAIYSVVLDEAMRDLSFKTEQAEAHKNRL